MMQKPTFFLDIQICTGCKTCMIACKDKHNLPMGIRWRRVVEFTGGEWTKESGGIFRQNVFAYYISVSCNHCREPICVQTCPTTAMNQDEYGIVSVDPNRCVGCRYCEWSCPYSAPQFDEALGQMTKCNFCREDLEQGGVPSCVAACPTRALQFGEYDQLAEKYGSSMLLNPLPPNHITQPNFFLEPHQESCYGRNKGGAIGNPEEVKNA